MDGRLKLTDEQRQEIVRLYNAGVIKQDALAKQFGVSTPTIAIILKKSRTPETSFSKTDKNEGDTVIQFKDSVASFQGKFVLVSGFLTIKENR